MKTLVLLVFFGVSALYRSSCLGDVSFEELFHLSEADATRALGADYARTLREALDDFNAVLEFKDPVHAEFDEKFGLVADGGTTQIRGHGYRIVVTKSLITLGSGAQSIDGLLQGPILIFDEDPAGDRAISRVTFYPLRKTTVPTK